MSVKQRFEEWRGKEMFGPKHFSKKTYMGGRSAARKDVAYVYCREK